jgi:hypothetical protein
VDLQQERGLGPDRLRVVVQVRPVRGPHFTEDGSASEHDVGDPELAADLDQLTAGDQDFLAMSERLQGEEDGGGVVVDDQRVLGAGEAPEEALHVAVARAAFLGGDVDLEIGVAGGHRRQPFQREWTQDRAAEIGVEHHAGGVDQGAQGERAAMGAALDHPLRESLDGGGHAAAAHYLPLLVEHLPRDGGQPRPREVAELGAVRGPTDQGIDGRQPAEGGDRISAH